VQADIETDIVKRHKSTNIIKPLRRHGEAPESFVKMQETIRRVLATQEAREPRAPQKK
jgi:hypothetical protein